MAIIYRIFFLLLFSLCFPLLAVSGTYEVGVGKTFSNIGDVPWENMKAGDHVLIYWRQQPYKEKWGIAVQGTEQQPFVVRGIPNQEGELPIIDGRDANTRSQINFWNENRGVIKIGGANSPAVDIPTWVVVENLDIRSGRTPYTFTGRNGLTGYGRNAASIYVENGQNVTIRNCILRDSGNGLFVSWASRNVLVEGCWIYDNGIENSIYEHNTYTAAIGMVYQFNYLGPLRANCLGNNLKDRSAGTVVRYNWIESGNRQLDLVDAEDSPDLVNHPSYRKTLVYGNILIEPNGAGNSQVLHYGGDSGNTTIYRKGILYFYNNTVVSTRTGNTTLMRLSTNEKTCDC
ncbi:MAG: polysaccharide-degrading enzyme [Deltaproteobacteria bacterium]|nr:polysaccharide-degrading enzyme [Deltaproteobacteria bacterium]